MLSCLISVIRIAVLVGYVMDKKEIKSSYFFLDVFSECNSTLTYNIS